MALYRILMAKDMKGEYPDIITGDAHGKGMKEPASGNWLHPSCW